MVMVCVLSLELFTLKVIWASLPASLLSAMAVREDGFGRKGGIRGVEMGAVAIVAMGIWVQTGRVAKLTSVTMIWKIITGNKLPNRRGLVVSGGGGLFGGWWNGDDARGKRQARALPVGRDGVG